MQLANWLKQSRSTRADFARVVEISPGRVTQICEGELPSLELAERIAKATGGAVTPNDFVGLVPSQQWINRLMTDTQARVTAAVDKGREWLKRSQPKTTEDRAFHLHGLAESALSPEALAAARAALIKEQGADGSWSQLPGKLTGDAYATGTVLFALRRAGLAGDDPAYRKGVKYLRATQKEDGSWFVQTRSRPVQVFFDNGDPGGKSQFISFAATGWAVVALLETIAPKP